MLFAIVFAVGAVIGSIGHASKPQCFQATLSDGTVVYMPVSKAYLKKDKAMRRAALRKVKSVSHGWIE